MSDGLHLTAQDHHKIDAVVDLIIQEVAPQDKELVDVFTRSFFKRKKYADLHALSAQVIAQLVGQVWDFFATRDSGETKIAIHEVPTLEKQGQERLVINVLTDNKPFLADSFLGILRQEGIIAHIFTSPLFHVKRGPQGRVLDLSSPTVLEPKNTFEALLHCEILQPLAPDQFDALKNKISQTMTDVAFAVHDWKKMRQKAMEVIEALRETVGPKEQQRQEAIAFVQWIQNNHFTFLGYREYDFQASKRLSFEDAVLPKSSLGILQALHHEDTGVLYHGLNLDDEHVQFLFQKSPVVVSKTARYSPVHRNVPMDSISIKIFNEKGAVVGLRQFLGLFTSVAYNSSTLDIPLLRRKVMSVVELAGLSPEWHDGKSLLHILDTLPRDELFQANPEELVAIGMKVISLQEEPRVALFIRKDHFNRYLSCFVYIPKDRFDYELAEQFQEILQHELDHPVLLSSARYGDLAFARVHYIVTIEEQEECDYDIKSLEKLLVVAAESWEDQLQEALQRQVQQPQAARLYSKYVKAFDKGYQEKTSILEVVTDIEYLEQAIQNQEPGLRIFRLGEDAQNTLRLKVYHVGEALQLSDILEKLTNMDLKVSYEVPTQVQLDATGSIWIHDIAAQSRGDYEIDLQKISDKFQDMFLRVLQGSIEDDGFNRLILRSGLTWRQCLLVRAFCKYLHQIQIPFRQTYIEDTLVKQGEVTKAICELFYCRFDPAEIFERKSCEINAYQDIQSTLNKVAHPDEDRILRSLANLVIATVRSNFFNLTEAGQFRPCLSFKFDAERIDYLPLPKPKYEIYVYSPRFEAVHLRGGKVARGGIRWSDRREDFRSEILGLVKAQMVKNSVIVPVGAKGGFVVKAPLDSMDRAQANAEGRACYEQMVTAMLEITDNMVDGRIHRPKSTFCYDDDDPYFVVAADKGTATFSDYANAISETKGFWLGDAFASGGKTGYDHKKMGITAKGAWESVKQHFGALGQDIQEEPVTVIGVGSMAGDVFGNGMLLSKTLKLRAALSHRYIFIDPEPNPETSFQERQRLFDQGLGWEYYNPKLLSKGGGVFEKFSKQVKITPEIQKWLNLEHDVVPPAQLIRRLLKADYDLLWLGGVGTYVKSGQETHAQVGDRGNDDYRVNADELKCKVIGEGANLGVTQNARIEFAKAGGLINNDAVDNSGGVDCSDHEVNIKILLQDVVKQKKLTLEQRNRLLENMTDEVEDLVLKNNRDNHLALSLAQPRASHILERDARLMRYLEQKGVLNRKLEFLPDDTKLSDYQKSGVGLTRPERAVLFSYAKNDLSEDLIKSSVPDGPLLAFELKQYFPKELQEKYLPEIKRHPLRREIISTQAVNRLVNFMGSAFALELSTKLSRSPAEVLESFYLVLHLYGFLNLIETVKDLGADLSPENQIKCLSQIRWRIKRTVIWFLRHVSPAQSDSCRETFESGLPHLQKHLHNCLTSWDQKQLQDSMDQYRSFGVAESLAQRLAEVELMASASDIIMTAKELSVGVPEVARIYFALGVRFDFNLLRLQASKLWSKTSWQRLAVHGVFEDLSSVQGILTRKVLAFFQEKNKKIPESGTEGLKVWEHDVADQVTHIDTLLAEARSLSAIDLALLTVVQRELRMFTEKVS